MTFAKGNLTRRQKIGLLLVLVVPLVIALGKCSFFPTSELLSKNISLGEVSDWTRHSQNRLLYILTVPMGAILVVFCRLTLGIRLLGPFRSILLALSFTITGIGLGIAFMAGVVATIAGIRPTLKAMKLPYFARVTVILSVVSIILTIFIVVGTRLEIKELRHVAYFPIFVLCLVGDAFSRILTKEGPRSAFWRGGMTVLLGILMTMLFAVPAFQRMLFHYPELLITQVGIIVVISEYMDFRWLDWMNPGVDEDSDGPPEKEKKKAKPASQMDIAA